eukprot:COSAG02_NODE_30_length_50867_cov_66.594331_30_plen_88_part_00
MVGFARARSVRPRGSRERDGGMLEPPRIILAQALLQLALPLAAVGSESEVLPGVAHRAEQHEICKYVYPASSCATATATEEMNPVSI